MYGRLHKTILKTNISVNQFFGLTNNVVGFVRVVYDDIRKLRKFFLAQIATS